VYGDSGLGEVARRAAVALAAFEAHAEMAAPSLLGRDPAARGPRRIVSHVPVVAALELRDPMVFFILMETGDPALHDARSYNANR